MWALSTPSYVLIARVMKGVLKLLSMTPFPL